MATPGEDIKQAVLSVLPSLPEDKLQSLLNKLESIGVESLSDLQFIKEEDLSANITPIQCRRLISAWQTKGILHIKTMHSNNKKSLLEVCILSVDIKYCCHSSFSLVVTLTAIEPSDLMFSTVTQDPSSSQSRSTSPSPSSYDSPGMTVNLSAWPENFTFPWNRMPTGIRNAIARETRPSAKDRREMVRIIVDEMRLSELNPSKSQCLTVARKIVRQHPKSFADVMKDGTLIGSGFGSLVTQLKTRVEHVNRGSILSRRRKSKNVSKSPADLARGPPDQYGCVRWQPDCPADETEESLKDKQREMKDLYSTEGPSGADRGHLTHLMKATYYLQRKTINASPPPSITELKNEWPYLFTPKELYSHFQLLTDIDILHKMEQAIEDKGKLILKFFEKKTAGPNADEKEHILVKYNSEDKCDPFPCVILLLMAHFKENPDGLILQTDVSVKL